MNVLILKCITERMNSIVKLRYPLKFTSSHVPFSNWF